MVNWTDRIPGVIAGTPVNRLKLMAMQGFESSETSFSTDGNTITEVYSDGTLVTVISGSIITETFTGTDGKVMAKTTTFNTNGTISEVVS